MRELLSRYFDIAPTPDRALRRHGREVHRRRGDGRLGHADRDRGRRRASRPRRARSRRRRERARRRGRTLSSGSSRSSHRRSRRHDRRRRPGHGRRRSRQHGLACPVGRRPGHGVRGRIDAALQPSRRSSTRMPAARAQGEGRARCVSGGRSASCHRGGEGRSSRSRGALRGARPRAAPRQGPLPRERRGEAVRTSSSSPESPGSASRGSRGSSRSTSTGSRSRRRWHKGRCPSYGEGVAYWALAEMVRGRAGILESEDPDAAPTSSLLQSPSTFPTRDDREWVEPRLAHLLGLADATFEREDLFAAWRLFFECLADELADGSRLRGSAVGRCRPPRLHRVPASSGRGRSRSSCSASRGRSSRERRPAFGTRDPRRLHRPLPRAALRCGDGRPARGARARPSGRAANVDPHARRGHPALRGRDRADAARTAVSWSWPNGALPRRRRDRARSPCRRRSTRLSRSRSTASRPDERRLVQDASVLGKTFVLEALASLSGRSTDEIEPLLKPSRGRRCSSWRPIHARPSAASTASSRISCAGSPTRRSRAATERRATSPQGSSSRPRGAAASRRSSRSSRRTTSLLSTSSPTPRTRRPFVRRVRETLSRAGERAASLGASSGSGRLLRASGRARRRATRRSAPPQESREMRIAHSVTPSVATDQFLTAIALFEEAGDAHAAARTSTPISQACEFSTGRLADAIERMERAYGSSRTRSRTRISPSFSASSQVAPTSPELTTSARSGTSARSRRRAPAAARGALARPQQQRAFSRCSKGRWETARALTSRALEIALENDLPFAATRGYTNLSVILTRLGSFAEAGDLTLKAWSSHAESATGAANGSVSATSSTCMTSPGRWDEAVQIGEEVPPGMETQALGLHVNACGNRTPSRRSCVGTEGARERLRARVVDVDPGPQCLRLDATAAR